MKPSLFLKSFIIFFLMILGTYSAMATHLRAGQITARRLNCNSLTFRITITVYTNTINTNVLFGGDDDILDFGDGSDPDGDGRPGILVPEQPNIPRPDLGEGVAMASYTIDWTYSGNSTYIISYSEPNRNEGVINMDGSVNTRFYIETQISLDPFFGCNEHTPILQVDPIDVGCTHVAWFHNPGAADLDGDSLSYELLVPFRARNTTVVNYRSPNDPSFYSDFAHGDETGTKPPVFTINKALDGTDTWDGTIVWNAPGSAGEYNIAFLIREWREIDGEWVAIGFVRRDMQIIIEECENQRPDLIVPEDICVVAGTTLKKTIFGIDPDNDEVIIEAFSEILEPGFPSRATVSIDENDPDAPNDFQPSVPPAELFFEWETDCDHVKDQPYQVVFKITDNPPAGPGLVTFKTWRITVIGPPPVLQTATPLPNESARITWQEYICENARTVQIWRRVDSLDYELDSCVTGMPPNLGYKLLTEQDFDDPEGLPDSFIDADNDGVPESFVDNNNGEGLAGGAVYCYRIVALFPLPKGGESYVSNEVCVEMLADEPVITNVTVDKTHDTDGQITVKWVRPFDLDPVINPPDFQYQVYRNTETNPAMVLVRDWNLSEEFIEVGLNTMDEVYNYQILARDANNVVIEDSSAIASSVRLEAQSQLNKIQLTWRANVPWSIQSEGFTHKLSRIEAEEEDLPVVLADFASATTLFETEVDVTSAGLQYLDEGPLETGKLYCYVVETLGTYGNDDPVIVSLEPFHNFSQIVCSQPGDSIPPCAPLSPKLDSVNCQVPVNDPSRLRLLCNTTEFANTVSWERTEDPDCGANDIAYYLVYYSKTSNGTFVEIQDENNEPIKVFGNSFVHDRNLTSFAGCYKIAAVDRSGNISPLSEASCTDNCPNYVLPNFFSPNGDLCNNVFSAYGNVSSLQGEEGSLDCVSDNDVINDLQLCARYVLKVDFAVFNRWGKQVYDYESELGNEDKSIYINWDGRSSDGSDLASGVYFYTATVIFETSDPAKREKIFKGWIQLVR
jgi:hypothetical protein